MEKEWVTFRGLQCWRDTDGVRRGFLSLDLTATGWEGRVCMNQRNWFRSWHRVTFLFRRRGRSFNAASFVSLSLLLEMQVKSPNFISSYWQITREFVEQYWFSDSPRIQIFFQRNCSCAGKLSDPLWERRKNLRETRIGHATPIVERYFKLPIQFWRSIESGIFNFLCNDHFHFPLNRASSCSGGQFHRNTGVLSRWFWFTYDSISNDSLLDGNFNSRRIISTMHHVENSRGKIFRWITQVTGRDKVDSRVWIKRNKFTVWNVRNISRKSILVWTGFPCTIYRSGIGARGCLENVEEVNKNQKGKTRREK